MPDLASQISEFHQFAMDRLSSLSPPACFDDVVDEWYSLHAAEEDRKAIDESLSDLERGATGRPVVEFLAELRDRASRGVR